MRLKAPEPSCKELKRRIADRGKVADAPPRKT